MSFLTPLFLIALAGLAIPVLLHLIQRERKQVVQFPSLMFLRRIPYQSGAAPPHPHWLLLMMRLAALALIVLAFARPFFRGADPPAAAAGGAREVVILVDRSYSMGYGDRWTRALAAARGAVDGLTPSIARRSCSSDRAPTSRCDRRRTRAGCSRRWPARSLGRRHALRPGAQARRQHPRRIDAAAPRGGADHRLPARRLARRRRRPAAGRRQAHAGR